MPLNSVIEFLRSKNLLKVIDQEVDVDLEMAHIAYIEVKKDPSLALLFTNPVKGSQKFDMPVLMNLFGSFERTEMLFGKSVESVAAEIEKLLHLKPPQTLMQKFSMLTDLFALKNVFPKRLKGRGECQEIVQSEVDLTKLPILKTWSEDGGAFITMGQVYTTSLDGSMVNLGMYRLQVYDKNHLGMHWQIHKDSSHFFDQYKKAGKKMPVSIAMGGDPLYTWCATAPLPYGVNELLLYGFIKNSPARIVKSLTNELYIPEDVDIVIEGFVDPSVMKIEGPFGDHTGYYTLEEPYPVMKVEAITHKKKATYLATVVGKPPIEDKYMGWATERVFLPLLKTTAPDLIDYHMPENGVFHNLILAKIEPHYKGHASQIMHAFWGVGQMSFVKHAIFVGPDAPLLTDYDALLEHILNRFDPKNLLITKGITDALDHSSNEALVGGKMGLDATEDVVDINLDILEDKLLLEKIQALSTEVQKVRQYFTHTNNPITVVSIDKKRNVGEFFKEIELLQKNLSIVAVVDDSANSVDNPYMLVWRVVNNIDAQRDVYINGFVGIDGTNKNSLDGFERRWPGDVNCDIGVLESLQQRGLIDIDEEFMSRFYL